MILDCDSALSMGDYYFTDAKTGKVRKARSGYILKKGTREETAPKDITVPNPSGKHDGMYNSDWE